MVLEEDDEDDDEEDAEENFRGGMAWDYGLVKNFLCIC